jgi:hypothetical protein
MLSTSLLSSIFLSFPFDPIIIPLPLSSFPLSLLYLYILPSKYDITEEQGKKAVLHITLFECFS